MEQHSPLGMTHQAMSGNPTQKTPLEKMQEEFINTANHLSSLYKESQHAYKTGYDQGKQEAYEEVFKWFVGKNAGSDMRHVSAGSFFQFLGNKLKEVGSDECLQKLQTIESHNVSVNDTRRIIQQTEQMLRQEVQHQPCQVTKQLSSLMVENIKPKDSMRRNRPRWGQEPVIGEIGENTIAAVIQKQKKTNTQIESNEMADIKQLRDDNQ